MTKTRYFAVLSGIILVLTGSAKLISAFGTVKLLKTADPILMVQFRYLMVFSGILECGIGLYSFFGKSEWLYLRMIAWLASCIAAYRFGLWWIGWERPCGCLGQLTDKIHLSSQLADKIMLGVLFFLMAGSYGILLSRPRVKI